MRFKSFILVIISLSFIFSSSLFAGGHSKPKELNIAYFLEWPTPNQKFQIEKYYDKKLGVKVNWKSFSSGNDMTAAMVSGDIDISYSQGLVPYMLAVSKGIKITMIGVAVSYAENDNCIIRDDANITKHNATELHGKKVGTLIGNVTHYKMLKTFEALGIDSDKVDILPMGSGQDAAAALVRGDIVMGCAFGGPLNRMKTVGKPLLSATEQEANGVKVFDVITANNSFLKKYPKFVSKFLALTEEANTTYLGNKGDFIGVLAKASGMNKEDTISTLNKFSFPTKEEQLSDGWMGGTVQSYTKEVADFFVEQGQMKKALSNYDNAVDTSYLINAK